MNLKSLFASFAFISLAASLQAAASFTDITIRQRWPWSQKVDISYTLLGDEAKFVQVELYSNNKKLSVPAGAFSGDIFNVSPGGPRTITFNPLLTAYTNQILGNVYAKLTAGEMPLYVIVDLSKGVADSNQYTFVTAYDLTNSASAYGTWEKGSFFHTGPYIDSRWQDTIVWTGVTNGTLYKTTNMVFRYVPAGTFTMGAPNTETNVDGSYAPHEILHEVTLTKPMFVSVFDLTQTQYKLVSGLTPYASGFIDQSICPTVRLTYHDVRSPTNDPNNASIYWPATKHRVATNSLLAVIRAKLGNDFFDLPTEAQYEYTCRAGTTGAWNNGTTITNAVADSELEKLGWYGHLHGWAVYPVGMKLPNGWGLYDMHGNAWNLCLDAVKSYGGTAVEDPVGNTAPATNTDRCRRNGGWYPPSYYARSGAFNSVSPDYIDGGQSIRLYWTLE